MRGFVSRSLESEMGPGHPENSLNGKGCQDGIEDDSAFDDAFYKKLIDDIANHEVSVDEAVELG